MENAGASDSVGPVVLLDNRRARDLTVQIALCYGQADDKQVGVVDKQVELDGLRGKTVNLEELAAQISQEAGWVSLELSWDGEPADLLVTCRSLSHRGVTRNPLLDPASTRARASNYPWVSNGDLPVSPGQAGLTTRVYIKNPTDEHARRAQAASRGSKNVNTRLPDNPRPLRGCPPSR